MENVVHKNALLSDCGRYRWWLSRHWDYGAQTMAFIMLNPSTADHREDDPTIRRCMGFAKREGFGGIHVLNLYSFRATDPKQMRAAADPVGWDTDLWLSEAAECFEVIVCAWGANAARDRVAEVASLLQLKTRLVCLGTTKAGHPRHPLYVKGDQPLVPWAPQGGDHGDA